MCYLCRNFFAFCSSIFVHPTGLEGLYGNAKLNDCLQVYPHFPTNSMYLTADKRGVSVPPQALADAMDEALPYFPGRYVTHKSRSADVI